MESRKIEQMNLLATEKQRHRNREHMGYQGGQEIWDELGDWD